MIGLSMGMPDDRVIQASDVLAKIKAGDSVDFDNRIIVGNLSLNALKIEVPVHFNRTIFLGLVVCESTIFNSTADFRGSEFNSTADFDESKFNGYADFEGSKFNSTAYFGGSKFKRIAYFEGSEFNDYAYFEGSKFNDYAGFGGSKFKRTAYFWNSEFNSTAYFEGSEFNTTDFIETQFSKEASFDDSKFNGTTSFNNSRFKEDALFEGTDFNCTLYLMRTKYDKIYIRWSSIKDLAYNDAAYLSLMENFKKLGYLEDYDNCYYEYRKEHRYQDWGGKYHGMGSVEEWLRKRIDAGLEIFYGYGKKPLYPLGWSIGTVLLFGIIWRIGGLKAHNDKSRRGIIEKYGHCNGTAPKNQSRGKDWRSEIQILADSMIFSITIFLSGTRLFIDPPELPDMPRWSRIQTKVAFTAERVLGAFFSILFFLAVGATVVR